MSVESDRREFQRAMAHAPMPEMATVEDLTVPGGDGPLRARMLIPPDAGDDTLVYVHGGGWYLGDLDSWEPIARVAAQATRCPIIEIEHRQAPEHPFPAPLDDVRAALTWAVAELEAPRVGADDFSGLPPAVVCVAEDDWLRAQGLAYAERMRAAGVPVRVVEGHGLGHAFLGWGGFSPRAAEAIAEFGSAVRAMLAAH